MEWTPEKKNEESHTNNNKIDNFLLSNITKKKLKIKNQDVVVDGVEITSFNKNYISNNISDEFFIENKCFMCKFFSDMSQFFFNFFKNKNIVLLKSIEQEQSLLISDLYKDIGKFINAGEVSLEYLYTFKFLFITIIFFLLVIFGLRSLPKLLSIKIFSIEKLSSYECGFAPFSSKSIANELHYLIVGIIFLIFDLEIIFIVPFVVKSSMSDLSIITVFWYFFLISATVAIELQSGAVSWPVWMQVSKKEYKFFNLNFIKKLEESWGFFLEKNTKNN